ncbi:hypothetical protein CH365_07565 [Leptospira neocaledonica]|uniref:DUF2085 domain-containing protein n=2 Tax=Leptospira neocaledonica TaxID=2023192 RepID=A0A2N0A0C5_9LEPT|nr:hypothetical protein CH365_07565 [Leptospira neocaledonica]
MDSLRESLSYFPYFCHQWEERSFSYKGHPFPVCARCTGVYFGQITFIISIIWSWHFSISYWIFLIMLIPMGMDWCIQEFFKIESNNYKRFLTGLFGGYGFYGIGNKIANTWYAYLKLLIVYIKFNISE